MKTAMLLEFPGATEEQYKKVWEHLGTDWKLLPGNNVHLAGPLAGGWWAMDVWDSMDAFQQAFDANLGPALQHAGLPQVQPRVLEVSYLIER